MIVLAPAAEVKQVAAKSKLSPMPKPLPEEIDGPAPPDVDEAGVDRAQIRAMLDLSPEERLRVVEEYVSSIRAMRRANEPGGLR